MWFINRIASTVLRLLLFNDGFPHPTAGFFKQTAEWNLIRLVRMVQMRIYLCTATTIVLLLSSWTSPSLSLSLSLSLSVSLCLSLNYILFFILLIRFVPFAASQRARNQLVDFLTTPLFFLFFFFCSFFFLFTSPFLPLSPPLSLSSSHTLHFISVYVNRLEALSTRRQ